jgi:hypothetical protein
MLITGAVPEFAFQRADRYQILRRTGILVRHAGQRRQQVVGAGFCAR